MKTKYRALTGLSYPTDPAVIRRLQAGERLSAEERKAKEVAVGEEVDDIPAVSIPWLLDQGCIELVEAEVRN